MRTKKVLKRKNANDANASGLSTVFRNKNDPNDTRNIDWHLGGKWIARDKISVEMSYENEVKIIEKGISMVG